MNNNDKIEMLDEGAYGTIYLKTDKQNENQYILKVVHNDNKNRKEIDVLEKITKDKDFCNTHALCLLGVEEEPDVIILKVSYIRGLDLDYFYSKNMVLPDNQLLTNQHFLIQGLKKLHEMNIYHMDIKPPNIMYDENTNKFRFIDFGGSCMIQENQLCFDPTLSFYFMHPFVMIFFLYYPTPFNQELCKMQDMYSLGLILFIIEHSKSIYHQNNPKDEIMNPLMDKIDDYENRDKYPVENCLDLYYSIQDYFSSMNQLTSMHQYIFDMVFTEFDPIIMLFYQKYAFLRNNNPDMPDDKILSIINYGNLKPKDQYKKNKNKVDQDKNNNTYSPIASRTRSKIMKKMYDAPLSK